MSVTIKGRGVAAVVDAVETFEGEGFLVRRPFPRQGFSFFDPFLLLDEMGPMDLATGEAKGAPDHPDRKSTRLKSSHANISYAVFCLKNIISTLIIINRVQTHTIKR